MSEQQINEKCACIYFLVGFIKSGVPFAPVYLQAARSAFIQICSEMLKHCGGLESFLGVFYDKLLLGQAADFEKIAPERLKECFLSACEKEAAKYGH